MVDDDSPSSPWTKERIDAVLQQHGLLVDQQPPIGDGAGAGGISVSWSSVRNNPSIAKNKAKCTIDTRNDNNDIARGANLFANSLKHQMQSPIHTDETTEISTRSPFSKPSLSPVSTSTRSGGSTSFTSSVVSSTRTEDIHDMFAAVHDWQQHSNQQAAFADTNAAVDEDIRLLSGPNKHSTTKNNTKQGVLFSPFSATYMGVFKNGVGDEANFVTSSSSKLLSSDHCVVDTSTHTSESSVHVEHDTDNGNTLEESSASLKKSSLDSYFVYHDGKTSTSVSRDIENEFNTHANAGKGIRHTPRREPMDVILERSSQVGRKEMQESNADNRFGKFSSSPIFSPESISSNRSLSIEIQGLKERLEVERYENELMRKEEDTLRRKLSKARIQILEANDKISLEEAKNEKLHARLDAFLSGCGDIRSDFKQERYGKNYDTEKVSCIYFIN